MSSTKYASKYMSLSILLDIRENHYTGRDGKDYCPDRIEELIILKTERQNEDKLKTMLAAIDSMPSDIDIMPN